MQRIFHTPEGVRDIYNGECSQKRKVQEKIHRVFHQYGYEDIETPTFEYFEVFSREVGTIPSKELYKFFDREGNTLVLRPDFTPSVSRACATYFSPDKEPVSLCYTGNTFINNTSYRGHLKETTQMGVERIGDESADADAELLAMTVECLLAAGLTEFQVSVGQVDYFKSLLKEAELGPEAEERLRVLISQKNSFGVEEFVEEQKLKDSMQKAFTEIPQMFGSEEVLKKARSKYQYYTGIIFQAYTYGTGEPMIKGGRYNGLMKHFGKPAASIGFAIEVDNLLLALSSQKLLSEKEEKPEVIEYEPQDRAQAIKEAQKLRAEGKCVALRLKKEAR